MGQWTRGDAVVSRFVWFGMVTGAKPVIVVEDLDDLVALYIAPGTRFKRAGTELDRQGYLQGLVARRLTLTDDVWRHRTLVLTRPGAAHCVLGFWPRDGGELMTWYVNLEDPLRHSSLGFDGRDLFLDIVVGADWSWRWKDEDEFAEAQRHGLLSPDEASAVRSEGERVIDAVEAGDTWWTEWRDWTPDPSWTTRELPTGWDVVEASSDSTHDRA